MALSKPMETKSRRASGDSSQGGSGGGAQSSRKGKSAAALRTVLGQPPDALDQSPTAGIETARPRIAVRAAMRESAKMTAAEIATGWLLWTG